MTADAREAPFWRVRQMAERAGAPLDRAMATGQLDQATLDALVTRCAACQKPDTCLQWMATGAPGAPEIPSYCLNSERIAALRDR